MLIPDLDERLAYGKPACTPPVSEMWSDWRQVTQAADLWLDRLTTEGLRAELIEGYSSIGTFMQRVIYHYWYHLGEGLAVRQMLGHRELPEFVGNISGLAPYQPESGGPIFERLDKTGFVEKIRQTRLRLDALVAQAGEARLLEPGPGGDWRLEDILSHVTWHEREMLDMLRRRDMDGSDLWNLPLEERNAAIHTAQRDLPLDQILSEYHQVFADLLGALEEIDNSDLDAPERFQYMPLTWRPRDVIADNTYRHYLDHIRDLQAWVLTAGD